ncbi:hypothetical protein FQA47_015250 [Oryzias melastigma]|uniref:Uncharacterized protein n=1 Tax=Oryzias melastigma TaxID=30732 RepID=A0A834FD64_ORYME|nr:hypothetical protein FQA47_015250 [Oryzias melastigma]
MLLNTHAFCWKSSPASQTKALLTLKSLKRRKTTLQGQVSRRVVILADSGRTLSAAEVVVLCRCVNQCNSVIHSFLTEVLDLKEGAFKSTMWTSNPREGGWAAACLHCSSLIFSTCHRSEKNTTETHRKLHVLSLNININLAKAAGERSFKTKGLSLKWGHVD